MINGCGASGAYAPGPEEQNRINDYSMFICSCNTRHKM